MESGIELPKKTTYLLAAVFIAFSAGIITAGFLYYRNYESQYRAGVERQLAAIAELKSSELTEWRAERLTDASIIYKNTAFSDLVWRIFNWPGDTEAREELKVWIRKLQEQSQYNRVYLLDSSINVRIAVPESPTTVSETNRRNAAEVLQTGKMRFQDFYRNEFDNKIYLAILVPIFDKQLTDKATGVLVLRIDPERYLYPFIGRWPVPSISAETLLARRDGNSALFLNESRFQKGTALSRRYPLSMTDMPIVKAVLGQEGIVEGVDYRGAPVIAFLRGVPESPWFLYARMDKAEVFAPLRERLLSVIIVVCLSLLGAGTGIWLAWRRQAIRYYRERAETAERLRESEERYHSLYHESRDAIMMLTPEKGFIAGNPATISLFACHDEKGFTRMSPMSLSPEFQPDGSPSAEKAREMICIALERGSHFFEWTHRKADGADFPATVLLSRLGGSGSKLLQATVRDITELKRTEDELRRSNAELEQFAYVASHDLQEPLRTVASYMQLVERRYKGRLDREADEFIDYAVDGVMRMRTMINNLLTLSRVTSKGSLPAPTDLGACWAAAFTNLKLAIEESGAEISSGPLPLAMADAEQITQLLQNLTENALKFRNSTRTPLIHLSAEEKDDCYVISMQDNGIGIEPQYFAKIFEVFQRLHSRAKYQGTGIGLAICRKIVERHGGRIWVESEPGVGTTFSFTLKKAPVSAVPAPETA
jgi:PAS domain S-box-containing protein